MQSSFSPFSPPPSLETRREDERSWQLLRDDLAFARRMIWIAAAAAIFASLVEAMPDIARAMSLLQSTLR